MEDIDIRSRWSGHHFAHNFHQGATRTRRDVACVSNRVRGLQNQVIHSFLFTVNCTRIGTPYRMYRRYIFACPRTRISIAFSRISLMDYTISIILTSWRPLHAARSRTWQQQLCTPVAWPTYIACMISM